MIAPTPLVKMTISSHIVLVLSPAFGNSLLSRFAQSTSIIIHTIKRKMPTRKKTTQRQIIVPASPKAAVPPAAIAASSELHEVIAKAVNKIKLIINIIIFTVFLSNFPPFV
jgi:hypothetical protein